MIHDKYGLDQIFLTKFFKEQADNIAAHVMCFKFHAFFFGDGSGFFVCLNGIEIHAGVFFHCIDHSQTFERFAQINSSSVVCNSRGAAYFFCQITEHLLGQIHHAVVIRVCLIQFHQGKFRVVAGINTLIPEHTADFIDTLQSADNQTFQIQLQRDAEFHVFIQCVIMGFKRSGCRAARIGHQHRSLHLHEIHAV